MAGMKDDFGKPPLHLLPPRATWEVGRVLGGGATKYSEDNWRQVENLRERYTGAALRHVMQHQMGDEIDPEFKCYHLAHAICSLMFVLEDLLDEEHSHND